MNNQFNDFLKLVAEAKKNTPSGRAKVIEEQVKANVKADLSGLFQQLETVRSPQERLVSGEPVPVEELPEIQEEIKQAITEVVLPTPIGNVPPEAQLTDMEALGKYLKPSSVAKQEVAPLSNEMRQVNDKIKFLEHWLSKVQNAGPGSGEVNFRYLDDVNRLTMSPTNGNWVLEYDVATKKVQFTDEIGPIRTIEFNRDGPLEDLLPGQIAWNPVEDCIDIKHLDGSTLQTGYEHYIQVHNDTGETLPNGTLVQFAGVVDGSTNPKPSAAKFTANSDAVPLYMIGILTNEIADMHYGRATTFGKVRNLNTTGSDVGEVWVQGDMLWAHPTMPGKMTKVAPTAPNVVISVAAVLHVDATAGWILVRPTIFPRLYFASFASDQNQTHIAINTPKAVTFNTSIITSGFTTMGGGGVIKALNAGLYNFKFSLQLTSSNSSAANVWIWIRHNGVDVPLSARKLSLSSNSVVLAPSWNYQVSMLIDDTFELMWAVDSLNITMSAPAQTAFCPSTPSATLAVSQVNL
jgi:hypothetical protein